MNDKFYIKQIIRDDNARLRFDGREIYLDETNTLLTNPDPNTTAIDYTDSDGGEMIRQTSPSWEEQLNGVIFARTSSYWDLEITLRQFFQINHTYRVIYIKRDGSQFARGPAWISRALQVPPTAEEDHSTWLLALTFGQSPRFEYKEDSQGNEVFANSVTLPLLTNNIGGEWWDETGGVWDELGEVWQGGEGGVQVVNIASIGRIYPIWVVDGPCINPSLQNNTTDTQAFYSGTVATGQTLVVDFSTGVSTLDGSLVSRNLFGQISCNPGDNIMGFNSEGGDTDSSVIKWNNIIG
jgi:hypothetical protein